MRSPLSTAAWVILATSLIPIVASAASQPVDFVTGHVDSQQSTLVVRPFWVSAGGALGSNPFQMAGGIVSVGWQFHWVGFDAKFGIGSMTYSMIAVSPSSTDIDSSSSAGDPTAERSRPRNGSDPWSYLLGEAGVSVTGRLFASTFPRLSERGRFAMGYGGMSDLANNIGFSAITYSFEGDLEYQLGVGSRWAVRAGVIYNAGILDNTADPDSTHGRLSASWIQEVGSIVYCW